MNQGATNPQLLLSPVFCIISHLARSNEMGKPRYADVASNRYNESTRTAWQVYAELGHLDLYAKNSNTCAARMSLALLKSGVIFGGKNSHTIKKIDPDASAPDTGKPLVYNGKTFVGKKFHTGAQSLADELRVVLGGFTQFVPEKNPKSGSSLQRQVPVLRNANFVRRADMTLADQLKEYMQRPGQGHGIIFFKNIYPGSNYRGETVAGGHIDLIEYSPKINIEESCHGHCYFDQGPEIWYWPLE
jgi:hypothetical protein